MALISDLFKGESGRSLLIGLGVAVLVPLIAPVIAKAGRPLLREAIKGALLAYDKSVEAFAELSESVEDIVAEVRAEIDQEKGSTLVQGAAMAAPSSELSADVVNEGTQVDAPNTSA